LQFYINYYINRRRQNALGELIQEEMENFKKGCMSSLAFKGLVMDLTIEEDDNGS
jgi:hypothetical protein